MWDSLNARVMARLPHEVLNGTSNGVYGVKARPNRRSWEESIAKLDEFRTYGHDWDGQGAAFGFPAKAFTEELIDSAVALAVRLRQCGVLSPDCTVPDVQGGVGFEWDLEGGALIQIEICEPGAAEVFFFTSGKPTEHLTLAEAAMA